MTGEKAGDYLRAPGRRILIMLRQHIGDVVSSTAAIHALRRQCPDATVGVSVGEKAVSVLENSPDFDGLITRPWKRDAWSKLKYRFALMRGGFDAAVILDEVGSQARNAKGAGIKKIFGIALDESAKHLTFSIRFDQDLHDSRGQFSALLQAMGFDSGDDRPRLYPSSEDEDYAEILVNQLFVILHPGASERTRHWLPERFAQLAARLHAQHLEVAITGSRSEYDLCEQVASLSGVKVHQLAGKTSVLEFAALAKRAACVVCNDTGPMHIAGGMGARLVALFGPTYPARTGPWGEGHIIIQGACKCHSRDWKTCSMACMQAITVEEVFTGVLAIRELTSK